MCRHNEEAGFLDFFGLVIPMYPTTSTGLSWSSESCMNPVIDAWNPLAPAAALAAASSANSGGAAAAARSAAFTAPENKHFLTISEKIQKFHKTIKRLLG